MPDRISRRTVLAAIPVAALAPAAGQTPVKDQGDKLQKANADVKDTSTRLGQISIAMDLEPAFTFHV